MDSPPPEPAATPPYSLELPSPAPLLITAGIILLCLLSLIFYTSVIPLVTARYGTPIPGTPGVHGFVLPEKAHNDSLTIREVAALSKQGAFRPMPSREHENNLNRGLGGGERWNRIDFDNPSAEYRRVTLDLIWRVYDEVALYVPVPDGSWKQVRDGEWISRSTPGRSERWRAFELTLPPQQTLSVFLHTQDYYRLPTQFRYWDNPTDFSDLERFVFIHHFAYFGLWFGLLIYGFFLYAMLRQRDQLFYLLFIGFRGLSTFFSSNMATLLFAFPAGIPVREIVAVAFGMCSLVSLCFFTRHFLETSLRDPLFDRVLTWMLRFICGWYAFSLIGLWAPNALLFVKGHIFIGVSMTLTLLWGSVRAWRQGLPQARFFFIAFIPYFLGIFSLWIFTHDAVVQDDPGRLLFIVGTGLNMLLLSLAPAYRHRLALNRNIRLHQEYTGKLESEVTRRTHVLQSFNDHLSSTVAERDRIITIIGHDLRTPAATLHSLARLLAHDAGTLDRSRLTHLASRISHACVLQFELLNNLLIWGGTQSGKWKPRREELCLLEVIANAWDYLESVACDKSITLRTSIPADLAILSDNQLLQTVLRNLLANAIKFSHAESSVEVACQVSPEKGDVEICVKDSGVGISPEQLSKLFGSAVESTPGTQEEHGSGIGLTLCRDLVRAVGGEIRIDSVPNLGTNISFTLPNALVSLDAAPA